ncbi:MAG: iron-sulfur cluster assembly accessory protein [Gammaproteobacteria bacterium]|nr:iron-sulfur cluster assembly accessory protein [Gammaproteobacteria bacterium]
MKQIVTFTSAAVEHIQKMLKSEPQGIGFRLSIKKTGCSGYAYVPKIINTFIENDIHFLVQENLPVYVDPSCAEFIEGTIIDYISDELGTGIKQKRLVFINPNEKNRCGCGESFTIE